MLVPFTRNFDKDPDIVKDPTRRGRIYAESKGILAWCVRGALAYQKDGLKPPATIGAAREAYKTDMDLLNEWLCECCEIDPTYVATNAQLWSSWESFAQRRGELRYIASSKQLMRRFESRGFERIQHSHGLRGRGWKGLRVKELQALEELNA